MPVPGQSDGEPTPLVRLRLNLNRPLHLLNHALGHRQPEPRPLMLSIGALRRLPERREQIRPRLLQEKLDGAHTDEGAHVRLHCHAVADPQAEIPNGLRQPESGARSQPIGAVNANPIHTGP